MRLLTASAFIGVGVGTFPLRSGVETLLTGGCAAALAYIIGDLLQRVYGV